MCSCPLCHKINPSDEYRTLPSSFQPSDQVNLLRQLVKCYHLVATSRLRQCNTRRTSCIPAPSTSVGAQRRRQTDTSCSQYEHVTPMLRDLHWLRSPERIDFKLAVLITNACMVWCHGIFLTTSSMSPIPTAALSCRRHPCS